MSTADSGDPLVERFKAALRTMPSLKHDLDEGVCKTCGQQHSDWHEPHEVYVFSGRLDLRALADVARGTMP